MNIVSFTEARNSLKRVLDQVVSDADCTVITRRDAEDAVVMSLEYYNSLMETVHLLKSPANAEHLARSIEQYRQGQAKQRDPIDDPGPEKALDD
ncbi:type II toxin-antitoxin system prevent-host-death family antitoxin [Halomonas campisalis]|uniref:Antitoxin n=1 Tax=Billgrantia campisalis TaxID=74661 RepID=A0ABS9PCE5_9GAMM|nr:type II toxin-antitoxin system prevent-host-death family antitoxin [Halomonas campisalis]MCG6659391.1 type II toxin-antitoxin system prevent-host-death family antitoxin [Halomonas campisalis]MDR5863993.1 type II toxin-antitoxin system prevent-host-death family antitoxin [Halomonas campisalis]